MLELVKIHKEIQMENMGEPKIKIIAMPQNANPSGNIFGGWILSQIDLAGSVCARELVSGRVVTIAMKEVVFKEPVFIGDLISCYAKILSVGKTSIRIKVEVIAKRFTHTKPAPIHVTTAEVVYVCVDNSGKKVEIDENLKRLGGF